MKDYLKYILYFDSRSIWPVLLILKSFIDDRPIVQADRTTNLPKSTSAINNYLSGKVYYSLNNSRKLIYDGEVIFPYLSKKLKMQVKIKKAQLVRISANFTTPTLFTLLYMFGIYRLTLFLSTIYLYVSFSFSHSCIGKLDATRC